MRSTTLGDTRPNCGEKCRRLLNATQSILIGMKVPKIQWGDTMLTAGIVINRMSIPILDWKYSLKLLTLRVLCFPIVTKVAGCVYYVLGLAKDKLGSESIMLSFCFMKIIYIKKIKICCPITCKQYLLKNVTFKHILHYWEICSLVAFRKHITSLIL